MASTLTQYILSPENPSRTDKTQHAFLTEAKDGTLPLEKLAFWLAQDRIYAAHAYPRFIGALISRIPFQRTDAISGPNERRNQKRLEVLVSCLDNIVREISFFEDTAKKYGMDIESCGERKATRDYTAEMSRVALTSSFEDGLVFLWAMEQVYLETWTDVKAALDANPSISSEATPALREFADNWSSPEFVAFVKALAEVVDELGVSPLSDEGASALAVWSRVVELESEFWP